MKTVTTEIRLARLSDAPVVAEVHDEAWRAAYRGLIPGAELEKLISRRGPGWWESAIRKGNRIALLGFGDEVAGYANYGRNRAKALAYEGEIYELYLRPKFIGLGLGQRLFDSARKDLVSHGLDSLVIWALSDNDSAVRFYRGLGGRPVARSSETFGSRSLDKTAFGWAA
jgi:ribosomal protein S18 acetylase RimI-like enzyme